MHFTTSTSPNFVTEVVLTPDIYHDFFIFYDVLASFAFEVRTQIWKLFTCCVLYRETKHVQILRMRTLVRVASAKPIIITFGTITEH